MPIQIGRKKQVPIYNETTTTVQDLSTSTIENYFTVTQGSSYGWDITGDSGLILKPSNIGVNSSTATVTLTAVKDLSGLLILGSYYTEQNYDKITLIVAGETILDAVSGVQGSSNPTTGSNTLTRFVDNKKLKKGDTIVFTYKKDPSTHHTYESYTSLLIGNSLNYTTTTTEITGYEEKILPQNISNLYLSPTKKVIGGWIKDSSSAKRFYGKKINSITYTGNYTQSVITINNAEYDLFKLTTSGTLTLTDTAEVWLCGGGAGGRSAVKDKTNNKYYAGGGGGGGYFSTATITSGSYNITIGAGGKTNYPGGTTSFNNTNAEGGRLGSSTGGSYTSYGGPGGSGGGAAAYKSNSNNFHGNAGSGSGSSTYPFGVTSLKAHCAGGGGGAVWGASGGDGGSDGSDGKRTSSSSATSTYFGGIGGTYGGGEGGPAGTSSVDGSSGTFYGAGGGGGGFYWSSSIKAKSGGSGYQGVVYIAIPK